MQQHLLLEPTCNFIDVGKDVLALFVLIRYDTKV